MSVSSKPVIIGAAVTPFGQFPDRSVRSLATAGRRIASLGSRMSRTCTRPRPSKALPAIPRFS